MMHDSGTQESQFSKLAGYTCSLLLSLVYAIILNIVLLSAVYAAPPNYTKVSVLTSLKEVIDTEIENAIFVIGENTSTDVQSINALKSKLRTIWEEVKLHNMSERSGKDSEWRPVFVILQGVIERSIASMLTKGKIILAEAFIVTPRIPTPLTLANGKALNQVQLMQNLAFAQFRRAMLEKYMQAGGILHAIYTGIVVTEDEATNAEKLKIYRKLIEQYHVLIDHPSIQLTPSIFPADKTGAIYFLNQDSTQVITIQSYQLSQSSAINNENALWSIKFGLEAEDRVQEIKHFLARNGADGIIDY